MAMNGNRLRSGAVLGVVAALLGGMLAAGTGVAAANAASWGVSSISPASGPTSGGTTVTVTGTNLDPVLGVTFQKGDGTEYLAPLTITSRTSTQIVGTTPGGAPAGPLSVFLFDASGEVILIPGGFTYTSAAPPAVSSISPSTGPIAGGTSVTITGSAFTGATAVTFGGTSAAFTVNSATQITATTPAHAAGGVTIAVTTPNGTSSSGPTYTYVAAPTVTSLSPTSGPAAGGTSVTITGTGLAGATAVHFGAANATSFTVNSSTQITATAPAGASGTVDLTVTTVGGTSTTSAADQYTYVAAPTVTSVNPAGGPLAGGTSVVITGTGFTGATAVHFGAANATSFTVNSSTQITAVAPTGTSGLVDVTVTTIGGTSATSSADGYAYVATPIVTGVDPSALLAESLPTITVSGSGFTGATAVTVGGEAAMWFTVMSDTTMLVVPLPLPAGTTADIRVTTLGGTSAATAADQVTAYAFAVVAGIAPASGPTGGGTQVVIHGSGFTGATAVTFGGTAATSFTVLSDNEIAAVAPAGAAGGTTIVVTNPVSSSPPIAFTYVAAPVVTTLSPASGPITGDTTVVISGTDLGSATAVTFGLVPATSFTVVSDTEIDAVAPAGTGTADVIVTTSYGTSAMGAASYLYLPVLTVGTDLPTPITGQPYSGSVIVTGDAGPFTYAVTAGALPDGLTLQTDGTITGMPTAVGTESFTITVTDTGTPVPVVASTSGTITVYNGALTIVGTPVAGQSITVTGADLVPGPGTLVLHSDPVTLGAVTVAPDGTFTATVTIPADTVPGAHEIELVNASDAVTAVAAITVQAAPAAGLASTGTDAGPGIALGVLLLLLGAGAAMAARRREA